MAEAHHKRPAGNPLGRTRDPEEMKALALAYSKRKVTSTQAAKALGVKSSTAIAMLNNCVMSAIRRGELKVRAK